MYILEKQSAKSNTTSIGSSDVKVAMVDGMVQWLDKPDWIKTCKDFHFCQIVYSSRNVWVPKHCCSPDWFEICMKRLPKTSWMVEIILELK